MVCDDGLRQSSRCLETADGMSGAAAESVWPQRLQSRPRCPHCGAWVSVKGECQNPRCSGHGERVVDMTRQHLLAHCQAESLEEVTTEDVREAAHQLAYEGVRAVNQEHNPFDKGDERRSVFAEAVLKGMQDLEADAEVVRVIMEGPEESAASSAQDDEEPSVEITDVRAVVGRGWRVSTYDNREPPEDDPYAEWDKALKAGRDCMVGSDVPLDEFVKRYRSPMREWQQVAYRWALQHPDQMLSVVNASNSWQIYKRGEYVEFGLPHHDAGGVRQYISCNGKSKVRINED